MVAMIAQSAGSACRWLALLIVIVTIHMRNGMRDTIEDYFDGAHLPPGCMMLNTAVLHR